MKSSLALFVMGAVVVLGCGSSTPASTTSAVTGAVTAASFPSAPSAVEATNEAGTVSRVALDGTGSFRLALPKGHTYRFGVVMTTATVPVVFPRAANKLDTTVHVATSSATVALGVLRHLDAAPAAGFSSASDGQVSCNDGQSQDNGADGECVDGKDEKTGAACADAPADAETNDDTTTDADPTKPMAVPEHNAPDDVSGCNDGEIVD